VFTIPVTFDAANRRRDKSVSLRFSSNLELSPEDFMELDRKVQSEGWLAFDDNAVAAAAALPLDDAPTNTKSRSQRLRHAICAVYYAKNGMWEGSDEFYDRIMDRLISQYENVASESGL
jgi:hypothetical protein